MNWIDSLIQFLDRFWPFEIVSYWERGVYFIFGRPLKKVLGPGLYPFIPWFMHIETVTVKPTPVSTPMINMTLLTSGKTLSLSATAVVVIESPWLAINEVDEYKESTVEIITAVLAEKLADVDSARVEELRGRLRSDLLRWVNEETGRFGIRVESIRFPNFAINQRSLRLLMDSAITGVTL